MTVPLAIPVAVLLVTSPLLAQPAKTVKLLKQFRSEFVEITPGKNNMPATFQMGLKGEPAALPVRKVAMRESFFINKYEVTQNLYEAVMGNNPSRWKGPRNSVEMMTWEQANEFCEKVTKLLRGQKLIEPGWEIRLPTEAEWEYCCRAGTKTDYSFGNEARRQTDTGKIASLLDDYAWHTGNAAGNDPPVGAKKPNAWGLYDMHGYLWEFVADDWAANYANAPVDGSAHRASKADGSHPMRGGSWKDRWPDLRSGFRKRAAKGLKDDAVGFRCVLAKTRAKR